MTLEKDPLNLIITGVGGQGNVLASHIVASAGIKEELYVTVGETYGASQRGGAVMSHVRFSSQAQCSPLISEGQADIVVGLEPVEALRVMAEFGNPKTRVIVSPRPIYPIWVLSGQAKYPPIEEILGNLEELADRVQVVDVSEDGEALVGTNVLMIGALAASGLLPIPIESFEEAMREILAPKDLEMNFQTFRKGMQAMAGG
ncbi:MAG: indolepyruvate ferredoxin oxidoreductase [Chloroflexi bacterium]|jgi:indolepyruvate ferredoxin oxidoreductase beta subunit|nr:MAG: indolepyruvate ferredoxin oxidoreductase [Chloroflexota bacterium]